MANKSLKELLQEQEALFKSSPPIPVPPKAQNVKQSPHAGAKLPPLSKQGGAVAGAYPSEPVPSHFVQKAHRRRMLLVGCGAVGCAIAYSMMIQHTVDEIVVSDVNSDKALGEVMDMNHGVPFIQGITIRSGTIDDAAGADIVVVTAGVAQKDGETRLALVNRNVAIFRSIIPAVAQACPNALLLIVSNPVDVLTYIAWRLSGFPPERVFGSGTVLDSARFRTHIAEKFHLSPHSIHAYIVGEHGDSEVPVWSTVNVAGHLLYDPADPEFEQIFHRTKTAAYEIIKLKGATSYAIGLSVTYIVSSILQNQNRVLTISRLRPEYDVCISLPTVVNAAGALETIDVPYSREERELLNASASKLRQVLSEAGF